LRASDDREEGKGEGGNRGVNTPGVCGTWWAVREGEGVVDREGNNQHVKIVVTQGNWETANWYERFLVSA
jgi:hypothetical protein